MQCAAPPARRITTQDVQTVVFYSTHVPLDCTDARLINHHAIDLRDAPQIAGELWLMLLDELTSAEASQARCSSPNATATAQAIGAGVCLWRPEHLFAAYPGLVAGLNTSSAYANETDYHMRRYYWLHASLMLWHARYAETYSTARFYWRMEPDVVFSGRLSSLLNRTAADPSDLLLHKYQSEAKDMRPRGTDGQLKRPQDFFPFWATHRGTPLLANVAPARRLRALVSIGRYSRRFLRLLETFYWKRGIVGFEEVLLPVACTAAAANPRRFHGRNCSLSALSSGAGLRSHRVATHFQYRPVYPCADFLAALLQQTNELWHPVKDRECIADHLRLPPPVRFHE